MTEISKNIEAKSDVHHGKPVIKGTRVPVHMVLGLLANGISPDEIIQDYYNSITREDIFSCIQYAEQLVEEEQVYSAS